MNISRRTFGQIAVSGLASAGSLLAAKKIPIAVQLYSIRGMAQKDLAGVLAQVAKLVRVCTLRTLASPSSTMHRISSSMILPVASGRLIHVKAGRP